MGERAQGTSRRSSWAIFLQFDSLAEEVVPAGWHIPVAHPSRGHQVAQEVKGYGSLQGWVQMDCLPLL